MEKIEGIIRRPVVAGYFYPNNPNELISDIDSYIQNIPPLLAVNDIHGLIAPHAGYVYSGKTAAFGYSELKGKHYKTVVVLAPSHKDFFKGACIYNGTAYATPLGNIEIDKEASNKILNECHSVFMGTQGHNQEHSLEVQLPFLQIVLGDFKLVPIVIGEVKRNEIDELASALAGSVTNDVLVVASSDLSHFYPVKLADILDKRIADLIESFDIEGLYNAAMRKEIEACGILPIVILMKTMKLIGVNKSSVLYRNNSGDTSGDYSEVVGYLSAIFYT